MQFKALVFSNQADPWHHPCGPVARDSMAALSRQHAFAMTWVESTEEFARQDFASFDVIVFISAHPGGLGEVKRREFKEFVVNGGGIAAIHFTFAGQDDEVQWPWWEELVGNVFVCHPPPQSGIMNIEEPDHPSCLHLPRQWLWTDEWYTFRMPFREDLQVLLTVDEKSYHPRAEDVMGDSHPIAWCHEPKGGRLFYTALGHIPESYRDATFLQHLFGGILWAVGERDPEW